jgi:hypothetical protein
VGHLQLIQPIISLDSSQQSYDATKRPSRSTTDDDNDDDREEEEEEEEEEEDEEEEE